MEDGGHDGQMRYLGVVAVCLVEGIGLAHGDVHGEGLAMVGYIRVVGTPVAAHEVGQPGVGTGGIVRRVG